MTSVEPEYSLHTSELSALRQTLKINDKIPDSYLYTYFLDSQQTRSIIEDIYKKQLDSPLVFAEKQKIGTQSNPSVYQEKINQPANIKPTSPRSIFPNNLSGSMPVQHHGSKIPIQHQPPLFQASLINAIPQPLHQISPKNTEERKTIQNINRQAIVPESSNKIRPSDSRLGNPYPDYPEEKKSNNFISSPNIEKNEFKDNYYRKQSKNISSNRIPPVKSSFESKDRYFNQISRSSYVLGSDSERSLKNLHDRTAKEDSENSVSYGDLLLSDHDMYNSGNGCSKEYLISMPTTIYTKNSGETECGICKCNFVEGSTVTYLQCCHLFHYSCAREWLSRRKQCPTCGYYLDLESSNEIRRSDNRLGNPYPDYQVKPRFESKDRYFNQIPRLSNLLESDSEKPLKHLHDRLANEDSENSITYEDLLLLDRDMYNPGNGFSEEYLISMPTTIYNKNFLEIECGICKSDFVEGSTVTFLQCCHFFDYTCAREWLSRRKKCPICGYDLDQES